MPSQEQSQHTPEQLAGRTWRMLREKRGMPRDVAATMLGISYGHLGRLERGERAISPELDGKLTVLYAGILPRP